MNTNEQSDLDETRVRKPNVDKSPLSNVVVFLLIFVVCFFLGNMALLFVAMLGGMDVEGSLDIFSSIADPALRPYIKAGIGLNHLIIYTGTALLFAFWAKGKKWGTLFQSNALDIGLFFRLLLLLVCAYPLIGASASLFEGVEWASQIDENTIDSLMKMLQMDSVLDLLVNLFIIALLPAIGEELLFRGVIQKGLVSSIKNHHVAIVLASIIFSAAHLQVQGFLPKLFIGLILGYSYYWTKSIWYPMLLHFINNGLQTFILFFAGDKMNEMQNEDMQPEMLHLVMVVIFSCFLCYLIISDLMKEIDKNREINV